ncbi:MAG: hypothetical protein WCT31_01915 [Candidatus Micrarchaeia archaeon]|jgi:hypothetical protein
MALRLEQLNETVRFGTGKFGAKTEGLLELGPHMGKNIFVPHHISLPIEFFHDALVRNGILSEDGNLLRIFFTPKQLELYRLSSRFRPAIRRVTSGDPKETCVPVPESISFSKELAVLSEIFGLVSEIPMVSRSDERTAKGIGAFSSILATVKDFETFLGILSEILISQFYPVPNAFKKRLSMEHGIGIQFMPAQGIVDGKEKYLSSPLSLVGFTNVAHDEVTARAAYGFDAETASSIMLVSNNLVKPYKPNNVSVRVFDLAQGQISLVGLNDLIESGSFYNLSTLNAKLLEIVPELIDAAKRVGADLYFELKMTNFNDNLWAAVQLAKHEWKEVQVPTDFIHLKKPGYVVGSGAVSCDGAAQFSIVDLASNAQGCGNPAKFAGKLVYGFMQGLSYGEFIAAFPLFARAAAVVDTSRLHLTGLTSHGGGIFREAGVPVVIAPEWEYWLKQNPNTPLTFYANELTGEAGIKIRTPE